MANKKNTAKNKGKVSNGMGSIRKRSNGSYEVRYTEGFDLSGKQIQRSKSFKTEREANEFRIKTLNQINEGTYVSPNQMPFKEWAIYYLNHPKLARSVVKDTDIPWMLGVFVMGNAEAKARYLSGSTLDKKDLEEIRKLDQ